MVNLLNDAGIRSALTDAVRWALTVGVAGAVLVMIGTSVLEARVARRAQDGRR
jgi:hypothetical protein